MHVGHMRRLHNVPYFGSNVNSYMQGFSTHLEQPAATRLRAIEARMQALAQIEGPPIGGWGRFFNGGLPLVSRSWYDTGHGHTPRFG